MIYGSQDHSLSSHKSCIERQKCTLCFIVIVIVLRIYSQKKTTLSEYGPSDQSLSTLNCTKNDKERTSCDLHLGWQLQSFPCTWFSVRS